MDAQDSAKKYIDRQDLSQAFIRYVQRRLRRAGMAATYTNAGAEIGVQQPMVSLVAKGERVLDFEKIRDYACRLKGIEPPNRQDMGARLGKDVESAVAELFIELYKLAAEKAGVPPLQRPTTMKEVLDLHASAEEEARSLDERIERAAISTVPDVQKLYEMVLTRSFAFLHRNDIPAFAVAVCHQSGAGRDLIACKCPSDERKPRAFRLPQELPRNLIDILERTRTERDSADLVDGAVITSPGADAESDPNRRMVAFWMELTANEFDLEGEKLRVWPERLFGRPADATGGDATCSLTMLFVFPFSFVPPDHVRHAMYLLTNPVHHIHKLQACVAGNATVVPSDSPPTVFEGLRRDYVSREAGPPAWLPLFQGLWEGIGRDQRLAAQVPQAEMWTFDSTPSECALVVRLGLRARPHCTFLEIGGHREGGAATRHTETRSQGSLGERWLALTSDVLERGKPGVWVLPCRDHHEASHVDPSDFPVALVLPVKMTNGNGALSVPRAVLAACCARRDAESVLKGILIVAEPLSNLTLGSNEPSETPRRWARDQWLVAWADGGSGEEGNDRDIASKAS